MSFRCSVSKYSCWFHIDDLESCSQFEICVHGSSQGLRFVLSPGPTAASKLFLTRRMKWASLQEKAEIEHVEVCPQAMKVTADIAKRVGGDGGGALIVDYGDSKIVSDSLQVCFQTGCFYHVNFASILCDHVLHGRITFLL